MDIANALNLSSAEQERFRYAAVKELMKLTNDSNVYIQKDAISRLQNLTTGKSSQAKWVEENSKIKEIILRKLTKVK